jgi:hypothetical protein
VVKALNKLGEAMVDAADAEQTDPKVEVNSAEIEFASVRR